jgi:hypothetical protein
MGSKRKLSQVFNNNPQASRLRGRPKNEWWNCLQTDIGKCNVKKWKESSRNRAEWEKSIKETKVLVGL